LRIGIMSASTKGPELRENNRLLEEIGESGHEGSIINYRNTVVGITESGRMLYDVDDKGRLCPIEVDAVIPRIGKFVESGAKALRALRSKNVYSTASPEAVEAAKDKLTTQIILDAAGVPTPYCMSPTGNTPANSN
jgi:glutathione synthase/RimK-type ligase-like ATP-grasp enzyme